MESTESSNCKEKEKSKSGGFSKSLIIIISNLSKSKQKDFIEWNIKLSKFNISSNDLTD